MPAIFEYEHTVTDQEIDGLGHVNNLDYMRWMLKAALAHSAAQGWPHNATWNWVRGGWSARTLLTTSAGLRGRADRRPHLGCRLSQNLLAAQIPDRSSGG